MSHPDPRATEHALAILRMMVGDGLGKPLTPCEKLACRVLLPVVGKQRLVDFCYLAERGNPMYRESQMESALAVIEGLVAELMRA